MDSSLAELALAVAVFVSTDIDDIVVLVAFFADRRLRSWQVVAGQYLGIGALCGVSVAGSFAALILPLSHVGLLGIAPISIGAKKAWDAWRAGPAAEQPKHHATGILAVALVTMANGGDNLAVYTPLFANRGGGEIALFIAVFLAMTALWCLLARWIVHHPTIGAPLRRSGHRIVPLVLIALGVLILLESGSYRLVTG
jgi:cadmium resistance protein CadD (predicted permease)